MGKQKGTFSIEFAIVGAFFAVLLMFSADIIIKLSVKGKLDRLSYSLVSLAKERTQLYSKEDYTLESSDITLLYTVGKNSLNRTIGDFNSNNFSMQVEEITNDSGYKTYTKNNGCTVSSTLQQLENNSDTKLSVVTSWGRNSAIYRVTLCYETDNLVAGLLDNGFTTVQSSAMVIGR